MDRQTERKKKENVSSQYIIIFFLWSGGTKGHFSGEKEAAEPPRWGQGRVSILLIGNVSCSADLPILPALVLLPETSSQAGKASS